MKHKAIALGLGLLMLGLPLLTPSPAAAQAQECTVISFEELGHATVVGACYAGSGVYFETFEAGNGMAWDVLTEGFTVQNPPSGSRVAHLSFGGPEPCGLPAGDAPGASIYFDPPVQSVKFKYSACNEVSITAYDENFVYLGAATGGKTTGSQPFTSWRSLGIERPDSAIRKITINGVAVIDDLQFCRAERLPCPPVGIQNHFNDLSIYQGRYIWFSSVFKVNGAISGPTTIELYGSTIEFWAHSTDYKLRVPNARITFSPAATIATTSFDITTQTWITTVPLNLAGNTFLSGLAFPVPRELFPNLPLVAWKGSFTTDTPGVSIQWKWSAAVYTDFTTDYNALEVKPVDDPRASYYRNDDPAGTPESFKGYVTGGAMGYGFTNYTGTYRGSHRTTPCVEP